MKGRQMSFPNQISSGRLFGILKTDPELLAALTNIRETAEQLGETIARDLPSFTDHSIRHMDALWRVAEKVLTTSEIDEMSPAEVFLLGAGFYLHDIGMAYAATREGRRRLEQSDEYQAAIASVPQDRRSDPDVVANAISSAVRIRHARAAEELAIAPIPGINNFIIEPANIRQQFGQTCGVIAASHHWSVDQLEAKLGSQGRVPLANGRAADIGFVAGVLRLIDYAHINRERAPSLARKLRPQMQSESAMHWDAQQDIDGPERVTDEIVYRTGSAIQNVDAWWLYYDLLKGLDSEIRQVRSFLQRRAISPSRFGLTGVLGASSPTDAAKLIQTSGFLPLEIHVRTSSMTRLVKLLAGESLYGRNYMAPVRELVQNAVDAVLLKRATAKSDADRAIADLPITIEILKRDGCHVLNIKDFGVGMSRKVITDHLLTVASDYWDGQYYADFPGGVKDFSPAGKFGIGFLSVFMLGDEISVTSQRTGDARYSLTIRGLGRRAELREEAKGDYSGTTVSIKLKPEVLETLTKLEELCRCYFPALPVAININNNGKESRLAPRWLLDASASDLIGWARQTSEALITGSNKRDAVRDFMRHINISEFIPSRGSEDFWSDNPPEYIEPEARLIASQWSHTVLCLHGFSLQAINTPGFTGIINSTTVTPDASRRHGIDFDFELLRERAIKSIQGDVTNALNIIGRKEFSIAKIKLLSWCVENYGATPVISSTFKFVQVIDSDGTSRYISANELTAICETSNSFFTAIDTGPNTTLDLWHARRDQAPDCKLAICFANMERSPRYRSDADIKRGSLSELFPDLMDLPRFNLAVSVLSKAWNVQSSELLMQQGWIHSGTSVAGFFRRTPSLPSVRLD